MGNKALQKQTRTPKKFKDNMMSALQLGDLEALRIFIDEQNVNDTVNEFGDTALHYAIYNQQPEVALYLV